MDKDANFSVPVTCRPYLSEFGVEGFVQLTLDVCIVGRVNWSDTEAGVGFVVGRWVFSALKGGFAAVVRGLGG